VTVRRALVIGGTSEIALATIRRLRADGPIGATLLGRDAEALEQAAESLRDGGIEPVTVAHVEAADVAAHAAAVRQAFAGSGGGFDVVILAVGRLGAQAGLAADPAMTHEVLTTTFLGAGSLLLCALRELRAQGRGTAVVLSSVAAERPRASNAVYGAAKAGLDALAQGLADSLVGTGVNVLVVRPGFVATKMTAGLKPAPFAASPEAVANSIARALAGGRTGTIWVPGVLRYVFALLRHLPRPVFRRLPL